MLHIGTTILVRNNKGIPVTVIPINANKAINPRQTLWQICQDPRILAVPEILPDAPITFSFHRTAVFTSATTAPSTATFFFLLFGVGRTAITTAGLFLFLFFIFFFGFFHYFTPTVITANRKFLICFSTFSPASSNNCLISFLLFILTHPGSIF